MDLWGENAVALAEGLILGRFPRHVASIAGAREPGEGEEDVGFVKDGCRFAVELLVEDEDVALGFVGRAREEAVGLRNVILGEEEVVDHDSDLGREVEERERLVGLDVGFWPL